jgi:hypothetical protein
VGDYKTGISKETADSFAKGLGMGFGKSSDDEEKKRKEAAMLEAQKRALLQMQNR